MNSTPDKVFRLLDIVIEYIGLFRTMQLLNEIDANNWDLAKKYPPLRPRTIQDLRTMATEFRLFVRADVQSHLIQRTQIEIKLSA